MNTPPSSSVATTQPPVDTAGLHPLVARLVNQFGASVLTPETVDAWAAAGGDRVLLLGGDPVRFPEALDVAVVLPELRTALGGRFDIGVARRDDEDAIARRFGSQRWPTLLCLREGQYVGVLAGMHDWSDYVTLLSQVLAQDPSRPPSIGIPLVSHGASASSSAGACH